LNYNFFHAILLSSGLATLVLTIYFFSKSGPVTKKFAWVMLTIATWAIAYSIELTQTTLEGMLWWIRVEYLGIGLLPACWIIFMIEYVGNRHWLTRANLLMIFAIPITTIVLVWTNNLHHLHYQQASVDTSGPFPLLNISTGIWYWVHTIYFYAMVIGGIVLAISKCPRGNRLYKRQTCVIIIAAIFPWIVNFLYLQGLRPLEHIDLTPYGFTLTAFLITFGLIRYKLFDLVPTARNKTIEMMHEGFLIIDDQHRILDFNDSMQKILSNDNSKAAHILGKDFFSLWPEEKISNAIRENRIKKILVKRVHHREIEYFEVSVTPFSKDQRKYDGALLLFWNVTQHELDARQLSAQAAKLEELNQLKDKLLSIISHDLRSPLASLKQMLDMMMDEIIGERDLRNLVPKLSGNLKNTTELLDNLLYWTKNQMEGITTDATLFDPGEIIQNNIALMENTAAHKDLKLQATIEDDYFAFGDRNMIDLVVRNLLSNAIKFSNKGGVIDIELKRTDEQLLISVHDQGVGIPKTNLPKLFTSLSLSTTGTHNEKGTGLGLMLCKDFVEKNGGSIWAESEPGKGTTFYFTLKHPNLEMLVEAMQ